jgi:hypothetical protein
MAGSRPDRRISQPAGGDLDRFLEVDHGSGCSGLTSLSLSSRNRPLRSAAYPSSGLGGCSIVNFVPVSKLSLTTTRTKAPARFVGRLSGFTILCTSPSKIPRPRNLSAIRFISDADTWRPYLVFSQATSNASWTNSPISLVVWGCLNLSFAHSFTKSLDSLVGSNTPDTTAASSRCPVGPVSMTSKMILSGPAGGDSDWLQEAAAMQMIDAATVDARRVRRTDSPHNNLPLQSCHEHYRKPKPKSCVPVDYGYLCSLEPCAPL